VTPEALAREYYRAIDEDDYEALESVLAPDFVQERGDMTLEGRERFVAFMRDERPDRTTEHVVETVYSGPTGVAVRGRLLRASGAVWFEFVDVFDVEDRLARLVTYTA
jgi:ketosteroid isomerase-like protein